jgi:hypothetical protein
VSIFDYHSLAAENHNILFKEGNCHGITSKNVIAHWKSRIPLNEIFSHTSRQKMEFAIGFQLPFFQFKFCRRI